MKDKKDIVLINDVLKEFFDEEETNEMSKELDNFFYSRFKNLFNKTFSLWKDFFDEDFYHDYEFYEHDDEYVLDFDVAGFSKDDLNVEINEKDGYKILTIKAQKKIGDINKKKKDKRYICKSAKLGKSEINFFTDLPEDIDIKKVSSTVKDGILTIRFPRIKAKNSKTIKIKVE